MTMQTPYRQSMQAVAEPFARQDARRGDLFLAPPDTATASAPPRRISIDLLRGFAIFWIIGADEFAWTIKGISAGHDSAIASVGRAIGAQLEHAGWEGFTFYDLIFPLLVFVTGVSLVFSLTKHRANESALAQHLRIVRRAALLYALGIIYYGGLGNSWPDIRLLGVLQRIALCYLFASILFLHLPPRGLVAVFVVVLVGYWGLLALVPVPGSESSSYSLEANLASWVDRNFLPGRLWFGTWDPEGLLSTLPAIATCLVGVFAGLLLQRTDLHANQKTLLLTGAGAAAVALGHLWASEFPIIKNLWTSSYVLVAGGYSLMLLALAHHLADVRNGMRGLQVFVWIGANAILIYVLHNVVNFTELAKRFVGGDLARFLDARIAPGFGNLLITAVGLALATLLARFLYRRGIFLRL